VVTDLGPWEVPRAGRHRVSPSGAPASNGGGSSTTPRFAASSHPRMGPSISSTT
jgi:hypothetical protein